MLINFYKYLSNILFLPILLYFYLRLLISKENKKSINEKFFFRKMSRPNGDLIWINGVSIGEAKSGLTVANEILKNNPKAKILFSTSTLTAYKQISVLKKKNILLIYSPLDINFLVKRFIKYWRPNLVIFMESEIWPNIIIETKKQNIKFKLLNGRISRRSFIIWKKIFFFSKNIFSKIDLCLVQEKIYQNRFQKLGIEDVKVSGNIKFLSDPPVVKFSDYLKLKKNLKKKFVITLFSSHEKEEINLINCHNDLKKKFKNLVFIIIPRHINKSSSIVMNLKNNDKKFSVRSKNKILKKNSNFFVVDTYGELGLFFKLSQIAIVGGSFNNIGGHNPIEVSHFNCVLFFGPNMFNFEKIRELILKKNAGFLVQNHKDLTKMVSLIKTNKKIKNNTIKNFKNLCNSESKKMSLILKEL